MKEARIIFIVLGFLIVLLLPQIYFNSLNGTTYKDYIVKHEDSIKIEKYDSVRVNFSIPVNEGYYKEITLSLVKSDSACNIILWGDRNSVFFGLFKDAMYQIDLPFTRYKKNNIEKDTIIINKLYKML